MNTKERFQNVISNLPSDYDCEIDGDTLTVNAEGKTIKVIFTGDSYVVGDRTLHFEDDTEEVLTWLCPMIMTEIDGEKRI